MSIFFESIRNDPQTSNTIEEVFFDSVIVIKSIKLTKENKTLQSTIDLWPVITALAVWYGATL